MNLNYYRLLPCHCQYSVSSSIDSRNPAGHCLSTTDSPKSEERTLNSCFAHRFVCSLSSSMFAVMVYTADGATYFLTPFAYRNRPLSRRLDRCDRVIQNESRDPFGGNVYYVTMQITFLTCKFRNGERNLHCDVVHITTKWVSSVTLDCNGVSR